MVQNYLKQNGHRNLIRKWFWSYLELYNERSERLKRHFSVFCYFLSDEVEIIYWESEASVRKNLNQNLVKGSFLEKGFGAILSSKMNVGNVWKGHFSVF